MAVPGFSISELIIAIDKCMTVYTAFTDEYESAPARIKELVDTCKYLHDILEDFKSLLEYHNDVYPQESSFQRKLDECDAFINKYRSLKQDYLRSVGEATITARIRIAWEQAWQTGQYALDDVRARDLKDGLSLEISKLVLFTLVFALRRTVPANPVPLFQRQLATNGEASRHVDGSTIFERLFIQLQSVQYSYKREMNLAAQQRRQPNLISIYTDLESVWHNLCVRAGLAQEHGLAPPLPRERLLEAPSQNLNDMIINLAGTSIHTTLHPGPIRNSLPPLPINSPDSQRESIYSASSTVPESSTANTASLPRGLPNLRGAATSIHLPNPAIPYHIAKIKLNINGTSRTVRLQCWESLTSEDIRRIIWTGEKPTQTLEHYLPLNSFPGTLHSSHGDQLRISFHEEHHLVLETDAGNHYDQRVFAEYVFLSTDDRKKFQGDLRDKDLVETFDFEVLWSKRNPRDNGGEAVLQDLKIWRDRHPPHHHSLSFFASTREEKYVEFPILWFEPKVKNDAHNLKIVYLDFFKRKDSAPKPGSAVRRMSKFERVSSLVLGKSPPKENSSSHSKRPSITSLDASGQLPNGDIPDHYRFLAIEFSTQEDAKAFVNIFEPAYSVDAPPTIFQEQSFGFGGSPISAGTVSGTATEFEHSQHHSASPTAVSPTSLSPDTSPRLLEFNFQTSPSGFLSLEP